MNNPDKMIEVLENRFRVLFWVLLAVSVFICSMGADTGYFYDIDETKYAAATSEMAVTGDVIRPMVNGMPRIEKPPLAYWVGLPLYGAVRVLGGAEALTPFAARFPAILAAVLAVAGTVLLGRRLYGPAAGLLSGLMVQTCVVFHFVGVLFKIDIFFTACVAWMLYFLACRYMGDHERRVAVGAVVANALAVLARGPFAYIPLAGYAAAGMIRAFIEKGEGKVGVAAVVGWLRSELAFLVTAGFFGAIPFLAWIGAAYVGGVNFFGGFQNEFVHNTTVERMSLWSRVLTTGFYADTLFFVFAPWGAYLPGALLRPGAMLRPCSGGTANNTTEGGASVKNGFRDPRTIFFFCVTIIAILVFSLLFKLKSHRYILPIIPLATVFVAGWLVRGKDEWDKGGRTLFELGSWWLFGVVGFFGYRFYKGGYVPVNLYDPMKLPDVAGTAWTLVIAAGIAGLFALYGMRRQLTRPATHILCLALGFCILAGAYYTVIPDYRPSGSSAGGGSPGVSRLAADKVAALYRPGTLVVHSNSLGRVYPGFTFFQKDFGPNMAYSLSLDLTPDLIRQVWSDPASAASVYDAAWPEGAVWPAHDYFHSRSFNRTILVLKSKEYARFAPVIKKLLEAVVESVTGLSVKWQPETLYVIHIKEH